MVGVPKVLRRGGERSSSLLLLLLKVSLVLATAVLLLLLGVAGPPERGATGTAGSVPAAFCADAFPIGRGITVRSPSPQLATSRRRWTAGGAACSAVQHLVSQNHRHGNQRMRRRRRVGLAAEEDGGGGDGETTLQQQRDGPAVTTAETSTLTASAAAGTAAAKNADAERARGLLVLATVPMVWGTYVPVVRSMYGVDPPIPGFVFSASYLVLASASCVGFLSFRKGQGQLETGTDAAAAAAAAASEGAASESGEGPWRNRLGAGLELGLYTFLANSLQVVGLETVPSGRAGFLIQLTTIFVPLVQATLEGSLSSVPVRTWSACCLALIGISVMGLDFGSNFSAASMLSSAFEAGLSRGDLAIVGAALLYTMHVVRLEKWANRVNPLELAGSKVAVQATLSVSLVLVLITVANFVDPAGLAAPSFGSLPGILATTRAGGQGILDFFDAFRTNLASGELTTLSLAKIGGATLWSGVVGTAYVLYAQSSGQRYVRPSDANLVYSLQPIFTALFAYLLLGETMETAGFLGGGLILSAVYLVASK